MPPFTRNYFQGLQLLFRPSGKSVPQPSEVSDVVQFIKDFRAWDFMHRVSLRRDIQFAAGAGVNVLFDHPEPLSGTFQVPVSYTWWNTGATAVRANLSMEIGTLPIDSLFGNWDTVARNLWSADVGAAVPNFTVQQVQAILPLPTGFFYRSTFAAPPVGNTVRVHFHWLDVPGELMNLEWFRMAPAR